MHGHIHIYIVTHACTHTHSYIYIYIYIYTCTQTYTHIYMRIYIFRICSLPSTPNSIHKSCRHFEYTLLMANKLLLFTWLLSFLCFFLHFGKTCNSLFDLFVCLLYFRIQLESRRPSLICACSEKQLRMYGR